MDHDERSEAPGDTWRRPRARGAKVAAGTALALGLSAGGYAVAGAASTPGARPATTGSRAPWAGADRPGGSLGGFPGGPLSGLGGRGRGLAGLVSAVGASSITLQTPAGNTVVVQVSSSTTYAQGRTKIALTSLAKGQDVVVRPTSATATSSSPVAAAVVVVGPVLSGRVASVSGSTITIADPQGFERTVVASSSTKVTEAGSASSLSAVQPGTFIEAIGTVASDLTDLDASAIRVVLPMVAGKVTAVDQATGTITIQPLALRDTSGSGASTTSVQVTTSASTRFVSRTGSTTLGGIAPGDLVVASGTPGSSGTFAALEVRVGPVSPGGAGARHQGRPWQMPMGPGMPGPGGLGSGPAAA